MLHFNFREILTTKLTVMAVMGINCHTLNSADIFGGDRDKKSMKQRSPGTSASFCNLF